MNKHIIRITAGWAAVGLALTASTGLAVAALRPTNEVGPAVYVDCMRSAAGTPDAMEHYVGHCSDKERVATEKFEACLADANGSADAIEAWNRHCEEAVRGEHP